jgi:hypothetical protein
LSTGTSGAVTSTYNALTGTWTASGPIANVNTLLSGLTFTPTANYNGSLFITTNVSDGVDLPIEGSKLISSISVNDAPVLDSSKNPTLTQVHKDAPIPTGMMGTRISSLVDLTSIEGGIENVTDPDSNPFPGIAVIEYDSVNLICYYSINNGASWFALGGVSSTSARLISGDSSARVYCIAGSGVSGVFSSAITFRVWDMSSGVNGSLASATSTGGTTAFSTTTDTVALTVLSNVNSAPVAVDDEYTVQHDSSMQNLNVLNNDTDADSHPLQITGIMQFASTTGDTAFTSPPVEIGYRPQPGFCGDDQFFYTAVDNNGGSTQATVTIHVVGCDIAPVATQSIMQSSSITYGCKDPLATNYNEFSANDPSLCKYDSLTSPSNSCKLNTITRTLKSGSRGEDVRTLQKFLNCKGFVVSTTGAGSPGKETDRFASATQKAVKSIQKKYGLKIDGIFGPKTNKFLENK